METPAYMFRRNLILTEKLGKCEFENLRLNKEIDNHQAEMKTILAKQAELETKQAELEYRNKQRLKDIRNLTHELHVLKCKPSEQQTSCDLKDQLKMGQEENTNTDSSGNDVDPVPEVQNRTGSDSSGNDVDPVPEVQNRTGSDSSGNDVDPVPEVQNKTGWFRRATDMLVVGLSIGVAVAGTILVAGITEIVFNTITGSGCSPLGSFPNVQQEIFSLHYITPPPF